MLEVFNITTYTYIRCKIKGRASLIVKKKANPGDCMTYCLPGFRADENITFGFFEQMTDEKRNLVPGGITYLRYNSFGFDPTTIAKQIIEDVRINNYQPYIISLSVGDQIARLVERELPEVKIIAINPAFSADCLKTDALIVLYMKLAVANFFSALLGWFGQARVVRTNSKKKKQSIVLYLDCMNCLAHSELSVTTAATKGVIVSYFDMLLDNKEVVNDFMQHSPTDVIIVDSGHANTVVGRVLYKEALSKLLTADFYPPKLQDA
jgi:hypothetical protein